jgi:hypothetical protein
LIDVVKVVELWGLHWISRNMPKDPLDQPKYAKRSRDIHAMLSHPESLNTTHSHEAAWITFAMQPAICVSVTWQKAFVTKCAVWASRHLHAEGTVLGLINFRFALLLYEFSRI